MGLPKLQLIIQDGNLNLQQGSNSQTALVMGCSLGGTANTLYAYGDTGTATTQLVAGKGLELLALCLKVAGGTVYYMPLNPSTRGGVSTPVKVGTGASTLTATVAPQSSITATVTTAGALGTAAFTFALGSGAPSAPVTSSASWSSTGYLVPGTFTTIVFAAGSYVAGGTPDIYTISTAGVIAHPQGAGPAVPTFTASPVDDYTPTVTVVTAGALGTMQFTYSLDGTSTNTSATVTSPGSGIYALPNTGIVLTFTGTSALADTWTFKAAAPTFTGTDLTAALTALQTTYLSSAQYALVGVDGGTSSAATWATQAGTLETAALALFGLGVDVQFYSGCPTIGTVLPNAGSVTVDAADTDSVVITARGTISAPNVVPCAGDALMTSVVSGLSIYRNALWPALVRSCKVEASKNIGAVADGGLSSITALRRDEAATPGFDAAGITSLRTWGTAASGFYVTDAHTGAASNSDYYPLTNARVIDRAARIVRQVAIRYVLAKIPTTTRGILTGVITEKKARQIEGEITSALQVLVTGSPQDAVAASAVVSRTNNVLGTSQLLITASVQPYGYAHDVIVTLGMQISA